jgi:hypothetical protein
MREQGVEEPMDHGRGLELPIEGAIAQGLIVKDPNLTIDHPTLQKR